MQRIGRAMASFHEYEIEHIPAPLAGHAGEVQTVYRLQVILINSNSLLCTYWMVFILCFLSHSQNFL